jgi:hypothetical protein
LWHVPEQSPACEVVDGVRQILFEHLVSPDAQSHTASAACPSAPGCDTKVDNDELPDWQVVPFEVWRAYAVTDMVPVVAPFTV